MSARLYTRQVSNPPEKWTRCEGAFEAIVSQHLFESAKKVRRFNEKVYLSPQEILRSMRRVLRREGRLSAEIIRTAPELPSPQTVALRFGSLGLAYEALGYVPHPLYQHYALERQLACRRAEVQQELVGLLESLNVPIWSAEPRLLTVGNLSNIEVMVCRWQRRHEHGHTTIRPIAVRPDAVRNCADGRMAREVVS